MRSWGISLWQSSKILYRERLQAAWSCGGIPNAAWIGLCAGWFSPFVKIRVCWGVPISRLYTLVLSKCMTQRRKSHRFVASKSGLSPTLRSRLLLYNFTNRCKDYKPSYLQWQCGGSNREYDLQRRRFVPLLRTSRYYVDNTWPIWTYTW